MHILTALKGDTTIEVLTFPHGVPLLVDDINAGECMAMGPDRAFRCEPWEPKPHAEDWKSIVFLRSGAIGDLLFLTPVLAEVHRQRPEARIAVVCSPQASMVFENLPFPVEVIDYPASPAAVEAFDRIVQLEGLVGLDESNEEKHVVDLFSEAAGVVIGSMEDRRVIYRVTDEERAEALQHFPRTARRRVGLHVRSSALCRTYPATHQVEVINLLIERGHEVFLFGSTGQCIYSERPHLTNLTLRKLTFRESCAMMETCDGFIAPDSSLCHVAGGLDIPTVALYGPFPWQARTLYHPNIYGINGAAPCAPCHHHKRGGYEWPAGGPCNETKYCIALGNIPPARVVAKIEQMFRPRP